ncbi:hypothetical protein ABT121_27510 [Streptomyces sp. NPDC001928]|uniref:hypothetical protein n=1 Tax=Streptomyces sp. NPDC001928 TaxID=3154404 RepID=UPI0033225566
MLDQTLLALASAAGIAVASAAGTDAWQGMRRRVAQILGRGGAEERVVLERLDGVVVELGRAGPEVRDQVRARVVAAWETRFHDLLDGADDERRAELVRHLNDLISYGNQARGEAHAGEGGLAVHGIVDIHADRGSAAAGVMGDVTIGNPPRPGPADS